MFANTMDVDYSLEEFARVLVANGYISDDCCFADADVPSLLSALDNSYVLGAPEHYLHSPYSNGGLPRNLEMTHGVSQSFPESCLNVILADSAPRDHAIYASKGHNAHIGASVLHESGSTIFTSLSPTGNYCSRAECVDIKADSLNIDSKEDIDLRSNNFRVSDHALYHPVSHLDHEVHLDNSTDHHDNVALGSDCCLERDPTTEQGPQRSLHLGPKQRRKRRSKGYSKPTKSKKKKSTMEIKSQPKAKKQKIMKDNTSQELPLTSDTNSFNEHTDILQDDSGFESGDKKVLSKSLASTANETSGPTNINSESTINSEGSKSLRRSSRSTRNTENYNFRLSSLVKRVETERRQEEPRQPKDKTKPAPLSKYRRRTANARERDRMKEINDAFDNLKSSLPSIEREDAKVKVTKFTILKHALNYIASLRDMLNLETILPSHDDDLSSDFSSVRPASVTSSGGEDSCSSPTSSLSATHPLSSKHASMFCISESVNHPDLTRSLDVPF